MSGVYRGSHGDSTSTHFGATTALRPRYRVAINKTGDALPLKIAFKGCPAFSRAAVYRLTAAEPRPVAQGEMKAVAGSVETELPALSVTTLVLAP